MSTRPTDPAERKTEPSANFGVKAVGLIGATAVIAWGLSFLVMPVLQGSQEGLDWFTSICRAVGFYSTSQSKDGKSAGGPSLVTWSPAVLAKVAQADVKKGEEVAADVCVACHNPNGMSADPTTMPSVAGQPARAIYKQLWDMKNGTRMNEAMQPIVAELTDAQITDIAAYYSQLKPRYYDIRFGDFESPAILKLVNEGDSSRALPACRSCHDARSGGPIDAPNLVGQYPQYLEAQLRAFVAGDRRNDVFARMRIIARRLTPEEAAALAKYYDGPRNH